MRIILQRVLRASVTVSGDVVGQIGQGVLLLVGVTHSDTAAQADWLANKIASLRIFPALEGRSGFDRSLIEVGGQVLVVSQFTLYGECAKGRRPDFIAAAKPDLAAPLIEYFAATLRGLGLVVATGRFGADMQVALVNDGPVTLVLERD
ncbi:MAG: D-aminoacyl-tRNA deacylase [Anaerolineae bacterium]|nr:D-aminoacyl-tRNA deacylase [Anaerolineae bacterium]